MSFDRRGFLADIERPREFCRGQSPLYFSLLSALAADLSSGEPAWFARLAGVWADREFSAGYEAPLLLLAAAHYRALIGGDDRLRSIFPTCGGKAEGAEAVLLDALNSAPRDFWDDLKARRLQTNEPSRSAAWLLVACAGFLSRRTPFHLVDMGTSGGLLLIGDYLPRTARLLTQDGEPAPEPDRWQDSPYPILSRLGLDAAPRRLSDRLDRLWLKACIWPDDPERHARFDEAVGLFSKLSLDLTGPRLERCAFTDMPAFVSLKIRPHPDEGLLLFNSQASDFLTDEEYARFRAGVAETLAPWEDRAFWAELEMPRGKGEGFHELTAHRLAGGKLVSRTLATMKAHPRDIRLLPGWDFLAPQSPPRPPRNTREEPPKELKPGRYPRP